MTLVYLHNALGQRVFKSEPVAEQTQPDPDVLGQSFIEWLQTRFQWLFTTTRKNDRTKLGTAFVYEGTDLLGEYGTGGAQSTGSTEYIYLPTEGGNILVGAIINGQTYAVHTDHLNTPRRMTDAANQPVWQWGYSAFGDNEPSIAARNFRDRSWAFAKGELKDLADGSDDVDNNAQFGKKMVKLNLRYPGQYFDDESNLHYNGFRSYSPPGGRYTQVDPIGLAGGLNPFIYVENDPLNYTDPLGLMKVYESPNGVTFHAYPGPPAGGNEHARAGAGESYHMHLRDSQGREARLSTETWKPLTPEDEKIFKSSKQMQKACEGLADHEKKLFDRVNRQIFHRGLPTTNQSLRLLGIQTKGRFFGGRGSD